MAAPRSTSPWRAVGVRLAALLAAVTAVAAVLAALGVTSFASAWGVAAIVAGGLAGLTSTDQLTRGASVDIGTAGGGLAAGPDRRAERGGDGALTGFGAFLLVGLPVAALGGVVLSL